MAVDRGMTHAEDPAETDAVQAQARGDGPYQPDQASTKGPVEKAREKIEDLVGGHDNYQDHGVPEPEL